MTELVSIIIPLLNEEEHIVRQLKSICIQDYPNIEIITVDGGSTDNTISLIQSSKKLCEKKGIKLLLLQEKDFGKLRSPANARNIGIAHSKGIYLLFMDADIFFIKSDSVKKIVNCLKKHPYATVKINYIIDTRLEHHLVLSFGGHGLCQSFYQRNVFNKVRFDPNLGVGEDAKLHRLIKWKDYLCDTTLGRHYAHTWKEFKEQSEWYGRTSIKLYRSLKEMGEEINPLYKFLRGLLHNFYRSIVPLLWIIFLGFPPWGFPLIILYLLVYLSKYLLMLKKESEKTIERLLFLMLIEWVFAVFSFKTELQVLLTRKIKIGR